MQRGGSGGLLGHVKRAAYVGVVFAAASVIFVAVLVGMEPRLIDIGLPVNSTTWVLFAVASGVLAMFAMLVAFRSMA
jgi:hypothetical protein